MGDLGTWRRSTATSRGHSTRKGRLILPAKLRAEFGESAFLTSHVDGCLALYDKEDMEDQTAPQCSRGRRVPRRTG